MLPSPDFLRGVALFNRKAFFEAHELMELAWRDESGNRRRFYQGVLQMSVAWYHLEHSNLVGAQKVLRKAAKNLITFPDHYLEFNLIEIRQQIAMLQEAVDLNLTLQISLNFTEWVDRYFQKIFPEA